MFRAIGQFIFIKLLGWKLEPHFDQFPDKYIIAVVPHTSNWDFPIGIITRSIWRQNIKFLAKASLFWGPFGTIFRWFGGYPIDRSKSQKYVDAVVDIFNSKKYFAIAIAPEGTRKKVNQLKTGFYFIAKGANIPILLCKFDYGNKKVVISKPFFPSDDFDTDFKYINNYFAGVRGKVPEYSFLYKN